MGSIPGSDTHVDDRGDSANVAAVPHQSAIQKKIHTYRVKLQAHLSQSLTVCNNGKTNLSCSAEASGQIIVTALVWQPQRLHTH